MIYQWYFYKVLVPACVRLILEHKRPIKIVMDGAAYHMGKLPTFVDVNSMSSTQLDRLLKVLGARGEEIAKVPKTKGGKHSIKGLRALAQAKMPHQPTRIEFILDQVLRTHPEMQTPEMQKLRSRCKVMYEPHYHFELQGAYECVHVQGLVIPCAHVGGRVHYVLSFMSDSY